MDESKSFFDFCPVYVLAHRQPLTRGFHLAGSLLGWGLVLTAFLRMQAWWLAAALVVPYALAWISHFFVEHNQPATFGAPLWSWLANQKMVAPMLAERMSEEVRRCEGRIV